MRQAVHDTEKKKEKGKRKKILSSRNTKDICKVNFTRSPEGERKCQVRVAGEWRAGDRGPTPVIQGIKSRLAEHGGCGSQVNAVRNGARALRGISEFL